MISENNLNQMLETFISIKIDAEYNETTPMMSFDRFHKDFTICLKNKAKHLTKKASRSTQIVELEKNQRQIWNQRPLKR